MKVILLGSNMTDTGGIQSLVATLANSFVNHKDITVDIINTGVKKGKEKFYLDEKIKCNYIGVEFPDLSKFNLFQKLRFNIGLYRSIKRYFRNYPLDDEKNIIIAFGHTFSCILPFIVKKSENIKLIGSQHNPISYNKIYSIIRKIALKRLDKYILLSEFMEKDLLNNYKLTNTEVIENPNTIVNLYGKSSSKNRVVISVGRLTEQKGFDTLIDIWSNICTKYPNWKLKIVGDGPLKDELFNKIKINDLEESITISGFTEDISNEYVHSDILAMTSRYEGFGLVLVEAQSCGLPTIAFDCPFGPRNIINDGHDGYLIKQNDIQDFIKKLETLMEDDKLRSEYSENAIKNAKRFSIDEISNKWIKLFNTI